ncbi:MAG TPA: hypothetical protein VH681_07920, partial [Nitrospiraceae bacterium]
MRQRVVRSLGVALTVVALGAVLIVSGQSFPSTQAATPTTTPVVAATPALPASGFTDVAKAVTPA